MFDTLLQARSPCTNFTKASILFRSRLFWFLLAAALVAIRHLGDLIVVAIIAAAAILT
jgi:hypothetical protein